MQAQHLDRGQQAQAVFWGSISSQKCQLSYEQVHYRLGRPAWRRAIGSFDDRHRQFTLSLNTDIRTILRTLVFYMQQDYDIIAVSDSTAALAVMTQQPVLLLITTCCLPQMDGVELAQAVKV